MVHAARELLGRCRALHFYGRGARDLQRRVEELTALVGREDVERYVLALKDEGDTRHPECVPHWLESLRP